MSNFPDISRKCFTAAIHYFQLFLTLDFWFLGLVGKHERIVKDHRNLVQQMGTYLTAKWSLEQSWSRKEIFKAYHSFLLTEQIKEGKMDQSVLFIQSSHGTSQILDVLRSRPWERN